jgi:hypothetical protein
LAESEQLFAFDREELAAVVPRLAPFATADPFDHVVIDDLLPADVLDAVLAEFPSPGRPGWERFSAASEVKLALSDTSLMGPVTRQVLGELNGQVFIEFLETITGIKGIIPDPHYLGGGLHQIERGGFLKVHADFNRHDRLKLDRRLNLLLYLNKDWDESYGGHLELWDQTMTRCAKRVLPVFDRIVIFATTDFSYHGHPDPLTCPADRSRRSLALYYYTNGRPASELSSAHSTLFRARPGEDYRPSSSLRDRAKRWMPPAAIDLANGLRRRVRTRLAGDGPTTG